jgi:hypothetical protein
LNAILFKAAIVTYSSPEKPVIPEMASIRLDGAGIGASKDYACHHSDGKTRVNDDMP